MDGFKPQQWTNHIQKDGDVRLRLMPSGHTKNDDDREGHILSVHHSHNIKENEELFEMTSRFMETHPMVRKGKQWDGVGGMIGIGEHLTFFGEHTDFVIKSELRNLESIAQEKEMLLKCGRIFGKHFI